MHRTIATNIADNGQTIMGKYVKFTSKSSDLMPEGALTHLP